MLIVSVPRALGKFLKKIGAVISTVVFVFFYFFIFGLWAAPVRLFNDYLGRKAAVSSFEERSRVYSSMEHFHHEG